MGSDTQDFMVTIDDDQILQGTREVQLTIVDILPPVIAVGVNGSATIVVNDDESKLHG